MCIWGKQENLHSSVLESQTLVEVREDVIEGETLFTANGNVNLYGHYGSQHGGFSKKLKT